jgi:hypothetical protein
MEDWEKKTVIFQFPQTEQVKQEIAKLEAEGWQLVEQREGRMRFDDYVVPLLGCLFKRKIQDTDTV